MSTKINPLKESAVAPANIYALFTLFCRPTLSRTTKMRCLVNMYPFVRLFGNTTRLCFIFALVLTAQHFSPNSLSTDRCWHNYVLRFYEIRHTEKIIMNDRHFINVSFSCRAVVTLLLVDTARFSS